MTDDLTATRVAELEALIWDLLAHAAQEARYRGYAGCTCINHSREAARAYETGRCPHQRARAAIATVGAK